MFRLKKKYNIWIERLNALDVILFLIKGFFCDTNVYYDEHNHSFLSAKIMFILRKAHFRRIFRPADLAFDGKDADGYSFDYRLEESEAACKDEFCNKYLTGEPKCFTYMINQYLYLYLNRRFTFITMVEYEAGLHIKSNDNVNIIILRRHPLNHILISYYRRKGYTIKEKLISIDSVKYFLKPFYHILNILSLRVLPIKVKTNISDIKPSIWVEYSSSSFIDKAFWKESVNKDNFDIVHYFDTFPIETAAESLGKQGFKWVDLHFRTLVKLSKLGLRDILEIINGLFRHSPLPFLWFRVFRTEYSMWFLLYKSVFKRFKTKILIQHQELRWVQEPQAKAIESAGGIMVGFHWSNYPFCRKSMLNPMHVFFVWGKNFHDLFQKKGNTCRYILPSGLWYWPEPKKEEVSDEFIKGLSFIIAVFDNTISYDTIYTAKTLNIFYLRILELIEKNAGWGGIIKSKRFKLADFALPPFNREIFRKMKYLQEIKKLIILDPSTHPLAVSKCAHLSVCYGIGTPGIIAGISDCRAVNWDVNGTLRFPVYKDKNQKILYTELDDFADSIIKASRGDREIGDYSKWKKEFNYFDDRKASQRVGGFIQHFMEKVTTTNDADGILNNTAKKYIMDHQVGEDFFGNGNIWDEINQVTI